MCKIMNVILLRKSVLQYSHSVCESVDYEFVALLWPPQSRSTPTPFFLLLKSSFPKPITVLRVFFLKFSLHSCPSAHHFVFFPFHSKLFAFLVNPYLCSALYTLSVYNNVLSIEIATFTYFVFIIKKKTIKYVYDGENEVQDFFFVVQQSYILFSLHYKYLSKGMFFLPVTYFQGLL